MLEDYFGKIIKQKLVQTDDGQGGVETALADDVTFDGLIVLVDTASNVYDKENVIIESGTLSCLKDTDIDVGDIVKDTKTNKMFILVSYPKTSPNQSVQNYWKLFNVKTYLGE